MFNALLKVVSDVVTLPLNVVADVVTLGGTLTDNECSYTEEAVENIVLGTAEVINEITK